MEFAITRNKHFIIKLFFSFFCVLLFCSCQHRNIDSKRIINSPEKKIYTAVADSLDSVTRNLHEGKWYFNFKTEVFIRCLKKIYPPAFTAFIDSTDASSSANIDHLDYNREVLKIADSLANAFSKRPEASWTIENAKVTMNICIAYRNSAELDSLAVLLHKRFYKGND
jgi:hypothetical protein